MMVEAVLRRRASATPAPARPSRRSVIKQRRESTRQECQVTERKIRQALKAAVQREVDDLDKPGTARHSAVGALYKRASKAGFRSIPVEQLARMSSLMTGKCSFLNSEVWQEPRVSALSPPLSPMRTLHRCGTSLSDAGSEESGLASRFDGSWATMRRMPT